ncbi:siderophore-interacting protein [Parafrankia sp. FMc2]|uniref:siderophore-interacting protein n=1 Tax=Parafrankia sp. FMc2 TaxID=3233196 RepID=UPI0034D6289B
MANPQPHRATVQRTERLSPHMIRVVFGGAGLSRFTAGEYTDHYVKLVFPLPGVTYPLPLDLEQVRRDMPPRSWPTTRTYTVRAWDADKGELTIDFVEHGTRGLAGPWAAAARPGDELLIFGPGGGYAPDPAAAWHLFVGDESALPAIAASLERTPTGVPVHVFVEVGGNDEEIPLDAPAGAIITWLHRGQRQVGELAVRAVAALDLPAGTGQAFVHGEATMVKQLRRILRVERGLAPRQLSISGYWRLGADEDGWQESKGAWNRGVEAEERVALAR